MNHPGKRVVVSAGRNLFTVMVFCLLFSACNATDPTAIPTLSPNIPTPSISPQDVHVTEVPEVVEIATSPEPVALPLTPTSEPAGESISFIDSGQRLGPAHSWDVALGDLDGDDDLDAFTANDSPEGNKSGSTMGRETS